MGFRYFVWTEAQRLGVSGYVHNRADGRSVEVEAEGDRPALEALLRQLREGPSGATVERVEATWSPAIGEFTGFGLRP